MLIKWNERADCRILIPDISSALRARVKRKANAPCIVHGCDFYVFHRQHRRRSNR